MSEILKPGTPLPWHFDNNEGFGINSIWHGNAPSGALPVGTLVAQVIGDSSEADDNAEYIVAACNAYPELVEALERIANFPITGTPNISNFDMREIARNALAKAGVR